MKDSSSCNDSQYREFRSGVGMMWAMADTDAWDLAEHSSKPICPSEGRGIRYYERPVKTL
jgi:hypothetical protein